MLLLLGGLATLEETLAATALASDNNWVLDDLFALSDGTKFGAVSDGLDNTGISVTDVADQGKIQTFMFGPIVTPGVTVDSVQVVMRAQALDVTAGYAAKVSAYCTSGVSSYESDGQFTNTSVAQYTFPLMNPSGGLWTAEVVNTMSVGCRAPFLKFAKLCVWKLYVVVTFHGGRRLVIAMDGMTPNPMS